MCDLRGAFSIRREYAYAIGARHLELLLDYILLPRRRWCLPPKYPMYVGRVSYLHATVSPLLEECFVLHVTVSIEFRFLFGELKNFFRCMLQSPILFSFLQCISRMWGGFYLLFFWANATGNFCCQKKQKTPFKKKISYEKEYFRYLFER